jgi:hypothetical protein
MTMRIQLISLHAVTIAASVIVLILTSNDTANGWPSHAGRTSGSVAVSESKVSKRWNSLDSLAGGSLIPGLYDLSFRKWRNRVLEPVSSLPVGGGPLVLFAHVEDENGNPAQNGTVTFEFCGNYEPKETCDAGLARWISFKRVNIGSCYCNSCGGLPGYDPGPGNACLFVFGTGGSGMEGDDGFRFKYAGNRSGIDSGMSGAANFTWTAAP